MNPSIVAAVDQSYARDIKEQSAKRINIDKNIKDLLECKELIKQGGAEERNIKQL